MSKIISIGCDPEVFLRCATTGEFVSAHGLIPGDKANPHPVTNGAIQVDGMACEFNTEPTTEADQFVQYVGDVFRDLQAALPIGVELYPSAPVATFKPEVFKAQPLEALEFGCDPDFNAYTGRTNPRPNDHGKMLRTAAGHVHIGFQDTENPADENHMQLCCELTKALDAYVGVFSLSYDRDTIRRSLYGSAGAFRPKEYGLEYRVLSNAWLGSPDLIRTIFNRVVAVTEAFNNGLRMPPALSQQAQEIINNGQFDKVDAFLANFEGVI